MSDKSNTPNNDTTVEQYEDFLDYITRVSTTTDLQKLEALYDKDVTIEFNGHKVNIPFDAVICNELINLMNTILQEY